MNRNLSGVIQLKFIRDRFPDRSTWYLVYAMCSLPVNLWSWVLMFDKVPSLLLNWSTLQVMDVLAYTQSFAFFESLLLFAFFLLLAFSLPGWLLRDRFVSQATAIVFMLSVWAAGVHLIIRAYSRSQAYEWNNLLFLAWLFGCLAVLVIVSIALRKWPGLEKWVIARIEQAVLLAYLFVSINILSLIFVILRYAFLASI